MNDKIIERLLEVNEKSRKASDIKFFILAIVLLLSLLVNAFLYLDGGYVEFNAGADNQSSITQSKE